VHRFNICLTIVEWSGDGPKYCPWCEWGGESTSVAFYHPIVWDQGHMLDNQRHELNANKHMMETYSK
jgi:hypothetical protein